MELDSSLVGRYVKWKIDAPVSNPDGTVESLQGKYTKILGENEDKSCFAVERWGMMGKTRIGDSVELMPEGFNPNEPVINFEDYFDKKVRVKKGEYFFGISTTEKEHLILYKDSSFKKFRSSNNEELDSFTWGNMRIKEQFKKLEIIEKTPVAPKEIINSMADSTVFKEWDVVRIKFTGDLMTYLGIIQSKSGGFYEVFIPEKGTLDAISKYCLYATVDGDRDSFKKQMKNYLNKRYPHPCRIRCANGAVGETYLPSIDERIWQNTEGIYSFDCFNTGYLYYQGKFAEIVKETTDETPTNSVIKNTNEKIVQAEGFKIGDKIARSIINEWGKIDKNDWSTNKNCFQVAVFGYDDDNLIIGKIEVHDNEFVGFFKDFPHIGFRLKGLKQFMNSRQNTEAVEKPVEKTTISTYFDTDTPLLNSEKLCIGMRIEGAALNEWCTTGENEKTGSGWQKIFYKYDNRNYPVSGIFSDSFCVGFESSRVRLKGFAEFYENWQKKKLEVQYSRPIAPDEAFPLKTNSFVKKKVFDEEEYNRQSFNQELKINKLTNKKQKLVL